MLSGPLTQAKTYPRPIREHSDATGPSQLIIIVAGTFILPVNGRQGFTEVTHEASQCTLPGACARCMPFHRTL